MTASLRPAASALTLVALLLAGCTEGPSANEGPGPPVALADDADCPASVAALLAEPCVAATRFTLQAAGCLAPLNQYNVPAGQSGIPDEWGESGTTPLTALVFLQSYRCQDASLNGQPLGAIAFGFVGGPTDNSPPLPPSNATLQAGNYLVELVADRTELVEFLAWRGVSARLGTFTVSSTATDTKTSWSGQGWASQADCQGERPSGEATLDTVYWHGPLEGPLTLVLREDVRMASNAVGFVQAEGASMGMQMAPAGSSAGTCGTRVPHALDFTFAPSA